MDSNLQTIQKAFEGRIFCVPDYQRGYAWEERHITDLLEDIEILAMDSSHYAGTLVVHKSENSQIITDDGKSLEVYNIVDGQQRLTTISIMLAVISEQYMTIGKESRSKGIRESYTFYRENETDKPRLILFGNTNEYYINSVLKRKTIKSSTLTEQRISDAIDTLRKYFDNKRVTETNFPLWLDNFYKKVVNNLKLTEYVVTSSTEVGVIFEVMNNRGKHLTDMEKIKNYLLYCASKISKGDNELGDQINKTWAKVLTDLMMAGCGDEWSENQVSRFLFLTAYDPQVKNWHGYDSIKALFPLKTTDSKKLLEEINRYLEILSSVATAYCEIRTANFFFKDFEKSKKEKCDLLMRKINRIGNVAPFVPLILAMRIKQVSARDLSDTLELIEKYAFRVFKLAGKRSNAGQSSFFRLANDFMLGNVNIAKINEKIKEVMKWYSWHERFVEQVEKQEDWYKKSGIKYLLYEYELFLLKGKKPRYSWDEFDKEDKSKTIEHILPQTPTDNYWKEKWIQSEIDKAKHDIGNLVITYDNSSYSNHSFTIKKGSPAQITPPCYSSSNLASERILANYDDWDYATYQKRRKDLESFMLKRWDVDFSGVEISDDIDEDEDDEG